MFKAYRYLYYKSYMFFLKLWGEGDFPHQTAMIFVALMLFINVFTLLLPVQEIITGIDLTKTALVSKPVILIMSLLFLIPPYFCFIYKKRYKSVIEEFKYEDDEMKIKGSIYVISYVLCTHLTLVFFCFLNKYAVDSGFTLINYLKKTFGF